MTNNLLHITTISVPNPYNSHTTFFEGDPRKVSINPMRFGNTVDWKVLKTIMDFASF